MKRPTWFPGYTVAGAAGLAYLATAPGQTFVVSQLNTPLRTTFGINELTLNTAYAIATVAAALPLVYIGTLSDRFGPRRMMAIIALLFGAGCMFMAGVAGPITVFIGFFLLRFLGQGALSLVSHHVLAMWFHRRLGSVHGVMQVAVFGLWILFPQMAVRLIESLGWRETYILFGAAIWLAVIPAALLLVRNRPEDLGLRMDGDGPPPTDAADSITPRLMEPALTLAEARRSRPYWTIAAVIFVSPLIGTAFLFDLQPMLLGRGMTKVHAANAVSAWTATMCIMALLSGVLTDRMRPSLLIAGGMVMIGLSALILMTAFTPLAAATGMAAFGIGQSLVATCSAATLARYFGRRHHGAIRSSTMRIGVIGTGLGTVFTGASIALTGGYETAMLIFVAMCVPLVALSAMLKPPALCGASKDAEREDRTSKP